MVIFSVIDLCLNTLYKKASTLHKCL